MIIHNITLITLENGKKIELTKEEAQELYMVLKDIYKEPMIERYVVPSLEELSF